MKPQILKGKNHISKLENMKLKMKLLDFKTKIRRKNKILFF